MAHHHNKHQHTLSEAAHHLREAMKNGFIGFGTDDDALSSVVSQLDPNDIPALRETYTKDIGRDLIADVKNETHGKFEDILVALLTPQIDYDAYIVNKAMKGLTTNDEVLIEVLCTRSHEELKAIDQAYMRDFGHNLKDDLESNCSGEIKKLLVRRLEAPADGDIENDINLLYHAGQGRLIGHDDSVFLNVLGGRPKDYIHRLSDAYANKHGKALSAVVESNIHGDFKLGLLALTHLNPVFFAEKLHKALTGFGTDANTLIRVVASQRFAKLKAIAAEYLAKYNQSLKDRIRDDFGGDTKKILSEIVDKAINS